MKKFRNLKSVAVAVVLLCAGVYVFAQAASTVYLEAGGGKLIAQSGSEIEMASGSTLDVQSGATVVLHGLTLSSTELGWLDGVTAGTAAASKAVVLDASKDIATVRNFTISGNFVSGTTTISEADLGFIDGLTAGTVTASKAVSVDVNKDASSFRNVTLTGALTTATATASGDVTVSADSTGGNALAKSEFIGLPRIKNVGIGTMVNGTTNTVITDIGDSETPATDWTAIDADTVMSNDGTYYRQGTASLKMAVAATADATDGCTNALATGDQDWSADESVGMWFYATTTLAAGDLTLIITDSVAGDTSVNFPAYATANKWEWIEIDISGVADASKDVITDLSIELSAAGAVVAAGAAFDVYMDFIVKWDGADEDSLGAAILQDGVLSLTRIDATDAGATSANLVEYTDYFIHYQSGNDAVVMITDQSGADNVGLALIAY